jgi:nicotinate-nucleotide--dimethylbenzimidazole phosphoribosyltransferase
MDREAALRAVLTGVELVREKKDLGYRLIATGEAGIGNTTTAAAMASRLLGLPVEAVAGRGAGLSAEGLARKKAAIRRPSKLTAGPARPLDVLAKTGWVGHSRHGRGILGGRCIASPWSWTGSSPPWPPSPPCACAPLSGIIFSPLT